MLSGDLGVVSCDWLTNAHRPDATLGCDPETKSEFIVKKLSALGCFVRFWLQYVVAVTNFDFVLNFTNENEREPPYLGCRP
jgi:hypothetical protein